jgi:GH15 family glucan-1,4-alpha-glucosidase
MSEMLFVAGRKWLQADRIQVTENNRPLLMWLSQNKKHKDHTSFPAAGATLSRSNNRLARTFDAVIYGVQREADNFLKRVRSHLPADGRMSEQYNRHTGIPQGAHDLTWSYSSMVEVVHQREAFLKVLYGNHP